MRRTGSIPPIVLALLFLFIAACASDAPRVAAARKIPIRDFFRHPEETEYKLSPSGRHLAFVGVYQGRDNLFVRDIRTGESRRVTGDTERDVNRFTWGNDELLLYIQDDGGDENYKLYSVDIEEGAVRCLTDFDGVKTRLVSRLKKRPDEMLIGLNKRDPRIFDLYRLNTRSGAMEMVFENPGDIRSWMADEEGVIRIIDGTSMMYRRNAEEEFIETLTTDPDDIFDPWFFAPEEDHVYAYSNVGRDKIAIVEYDMAKGREVRVLFEHPEYDTFGDDERDLFDYCAKKEKLLYALYTGERRTYHFFDPEMAAWHWRLRERLGDYEIAIESRNDDADRFVLLVTSDRLPGRYYLYDANADDLQFLRDAAPWLEEARMAETRLIRYEARDGLLIHGYLTIPAGAEPKNLPLIVHPHAGPQWRNSWGFDAKTQFLANRGYAVFQPNFRGSEGYGKAFMRAGFKQWGLAMQDDITDGVHWLIDQGIADPDRIAILGWSFGGYAALAGMAFTPEIYACGVDMWGISNYFTFFGSFPAYWGPYLDEIRVRWGDPVEDSLQMAETSPALHADKFRAPILIVQGENDPRVKMSQSEEMVNALREAGKDVEYVLIPGEGHALSDEKKTIELMEKIEDFLARHMGKDVP
ncbi:MAG: S9 family peptidase [Candidatus Eisenbacteria bacterium]|nr:S9 family peptidase [Candidatus Eisenbacteria bacterium]